MVVWETYTKRQRRLRGEMPDVYVYDDLPKKLKTQIVHIYRSAIDGSSVNSQHLMAYSAAVNLLRQENGVFNLNNNIYQDGEAEFTEYFLNEKDIEQSLSAIEIIFYLIDKKIRHVTYYDRRTQHADNAINELNIRFKESGVGYQYESEKIIRIDSEILHAEAVKPALTLLRDPRFSGANAEFLSAHDHYRDGKYKECLTDCAKSFESTMKIICDKRQWAYTPTDPAKKLIDVILDNELVEKYWQAHFTSLRSMLESGIPTPRNKKAAHGQGGDIKDVPPYLASYVLHQTAATILMLIEADKAKP